MSAQLEFPLAPGWVNQDVALYHGTLLSSAHSILERVTLDTAKGRTDFGRGFYTTTSLPQAKRFAQDKSTSRREYGAVVALALRREDLAYLSSLVFLNGEPTAQYYWSFVQFCRSPAEGHGRSQGNPFYDTVWGPVTKNCWGGRTIYPNFDQISFHTGDALALLNQPGRRRIIWTCKPSKTR